uniref:Uncharacterized protein n=1 Tax=Entomoneis paludosa TaxID=265537 RepID=A0A7S2YJF9_9STRA|mmetsp:Transcript_35091/g.73082  ORF Transcript_35091/g.73082 Transcript_35091/m.73082 type:complete len:180 (+) Transcript_35091:94-633(+)
MSFITSVFDLEFLTSRTGMITVIATVILALGICLFIPFFHVDEVVQMGRRPTLGTSINLEGLDLDFDVSESSSVGGPNSRKQRKKSSIFSFIWLGNQLGNQPLRPVNEGEDETLDKSENILFNINEDEEDEDGNGEDEKLPTFPKKEVPNTATHRRTSGSREQSRDSDGRRKRNLIAGR